MLLWINGPFGSGKTQTSHELQRRLPGSIICDPEHIGFGLHRTLPPRLRRDFQNIPAWRQGVYEVLDRALTECDDTLIARPTARRSSAMSLPHRGGHYLRPSITAPIAGRSR